MNIRDQVRLNEMVLSAVDGRLGPDQQAELNDWLGRDDQALTCYVECMQVLVSLRCPSLSDAVLAAAEPGRTGSWRKDAGVAQTGMGATLNESDALPADMDEPLNMDTPIWQALLQREKTAPTLPEIKPVEEPPAKPRPPARRPRPQSRFSLYVAIGSVAALAMLVIMMQLPPFAPAPIVGQVVDCLETRWEPQASVLFPADAVRAGERRLAGGTIQLELISGVKLVVEGPAVFTIESPERVVLESGKAFARVPHEARGFTIETAAGEFRDLGTEFGVSAGQRERSEVHVFTGEVAVRSRNGNGRTVLHERQASALDGVSGRVEALEFAERSFVRHISSKRGFSWTGAPLSLANLVAGGDGFRGGNYDCGIDPVTGQVNRQADMGNMGVVGNKELMPVPERWAIDAVFVPDGGDGAIWIDSLGREFAGFPDTDCGVWGDISALGQVLEAWLAGSSKTVLQLSLDGEELGGQDREVILMHPNAGMTFDLAAIRRSVGGLKLTRFRSRCGISENAPRVERPSQFWVLVDGEVAFQWEAKGPTSLPQEIDIPLGYDARRLTLATTATADKSYAWCLFVEPVLELEPIGPEQ